MDEIQVAETLTELQYNAMTRASCEFNFHNTESSKDHAEMETSFNERVTKESATQTTVELVNIPYTDVMLTNKDTMRRALFIETVKNPAHCCHYTGLHITVLMAIYDLVKEKASQMYTWRGSKATKASGSHAKHLEAKLRQSKLDILEQLILTLVRLRRKPSIIMLANLFGIAPATATKVFISWILFLKQELAFLVPFSTLEDMHGIKVPKAFREFPNLRCIIDCTEFYIEKPFRIASQRSTYSSYKARNTFKMLVSISPIPHFNFASDLFSGSISDKEIVRKSGFLEYLQPGDVVMADKGFNVQDLLALHQTRLIAPPLMKKGSISAKASTANQENSKATCSC